MTKYISAEEARSLGIEAVHQEMENGERRFRLVSSDGSSYIRTEASKEGGWQNSHFHEQLTEIYIVQSGWLVYAELSSEGKLSLKLMGRRRKHNCKSFRSSQPIYVAAHCHSCSQIRQR